MTRTFLRAALPWLAATAAWLPSAQAAEPAFILGVTTHLMNVEQPLQAPLKRAAEAGFTSLRDDILWSAAAPGPHQLHVPPQWRRYLSQAETLKLSRMGILGYSTWFHQNAKPRTPQVTGAFLKYVDYTSQQLGNRINFYEIWNEWDMEAPRDRQLARDYAELIKQTAPVLRRNTRAAPGTPAKILVGAVTTAGMKSGFVDPLIDSGALDLVDGLSLHPYVHCEANDQNTPEAWWRWMVDYERHVRTRAGRDVPLYFTEMGWPSHQGACGKSEVTQALYMARVWFLARTIPNVKGLWWYDLYNDGPDRFDQEHNFGVVNQDLSPKPAYTLMKAIAPLVSQYTYEAQASALSDTVYQLHFSKGQERVLVAWAIGKPRELQVESHAPISGPVRWLDTVHAERGHIASEQAWQCDQGRCKATIALTRFPKIIRLTP
ncbi:hypothetical protein [Pseudomonas syringae]|nr:hypothetical protein [Pseudomonas syringae]